MLASSTNIKREASDIRTGEAKNTPEVEHEAKYSMMVIYSQERSAVSASGSAACYINLSSGCVAETCAYKRKCTYLASNAKANTPAASGAAADVPE